MTTVEFIGMIAPQQYSEILSPAGPPVDPAFTRAFARAHEDAGFDRVLIGYFSTAPDGMIVAAHVLDHTERLGVLLAHRPGFVAPTVAARQMATLDQFSGGRLAVHIITGGDDADLARDGDQFALVPRQQELLAKPHDRRGRVVRLDDFDMVTTRRQHIDDHRVEIHGKCG